MQRAPLLFIHHLIHFVQQSFHIVCMGRTADDGADTDLLEGAGSAILPETAFPQFSQDVFRDSAVVDGHKFIAAEPVNRSLLCQDTGADIGEMFQVGISPDGHTDR